MQQHHCARPVTAAAVSPQRPRYRCQLRMSGFLAQINQTLLERGVRTIPRIAPHLTVGLAWLLVGWCQQSAIVFLRQCLPLQIESARQSRFARSFAAAVLMHDHPAQRLHGRWNPDGVVNRIDKLARLSRSLVTHPVVRRLGCRKDIIRRLLSGHGSDQGNE